ncbi:MULTISPECIES: nickel pincer cofactor biosynthesis protein LarB [unclassified Pseudodesulfovibrio]|uniref:nickel pincer cofactor biosynthesis protein LarB n=1 Tax=unclassified Pseudodesulfovibrio TaxID=2661612 RepID=UPI000FEBE268|nr:MULTISPECIES: nickel pincer cofactor biosynthesis protein LarB [unclassified Pseudodesulfovibrio]MCJ2165176.1 nickel pincer cofactor biosynthesis protein LarB [Pseudodesulfovibrio sp. S3-i]RWU03374.1 nickel pincer cofactor biosynthesis protein LarB [Pseudodesulfovibrio sp. S3]
MSLDQLMDDFEAGRISRDDFKKGVLERSFIEAGCAKIDHHRELRTGGPEVVYCQGKTPQQVASIFAHMAKHSGRVLGTRADTAHFQAVNAVVKVLFDAESRLLVVGEPAADPIGKIVVVSAGTSDQSVAEEAAGTAEFLGSRVERHYDCGVAGIHRLFSVMDEMNDASVIIAVAGMEGALPSVIGGMARPPIVAVPTSVGYGANFQGLSALLAMMNSCAPGVGVVNIDNGFGAGFLAHKINVLAVSRHS